MGGEGPQSIIFNRGESVLAVRAERAESINHF
jgi:hypothetical protein